MGGRDSRRGRAPNEKKKLKRDGDGAKVGRYQRWRETSVWGLQVFAAVGLCSPHCGDQLSGFFSVSGDSFEVPTI